MKRKKKQKSDYISDEDFQRMMKLQMATTREEVIKILRTDPNLTEERIQRMIELWPEEFLGQTTPEKKSPSKGISQEAINTLLDLSITTEEALNKSAEITIKEAEKRPTWDDFFNVSTRQEKEAILQKILGESLTPEEMEKFFPKD